MCRASSSGRRFWEASRGPLWPGSRGVLFLNLHVASGHRWNRGGNGFLGIGLLGVWLGRLDPVRRFCQGKAKSNRPTHGRLPFPSHISDEGGCRAFGADSSCFSNGSTQDESILVQHQRTCCFEWKSTTVLSPIVHTYYCIDCNKATQPVPVRRQRKLTTNPIRRLAP